MQGTGFLNTDCSETCSDKAHNSPTTEFQGHEQDLEGNKDKDMSRELELGREFGCHDLCNFDDFWKQKPDATGKLGLLPEQKMTGALRMLAYGAGVDQCDEITRMGASTALKCLKKFCAQVEYLYGGWYLRSPNAADMQRLLHKGQQRGFPGMIGSIDCMHWKWKNCPKGWSGAFSGRKGYPTVILEAVAS